MKTMDQAPLPIIHPHLDPRLAIGTLFLEPKTIGLVPLPDQVSTLVKPPISPEMEGLHPMALIGAKVESNLNLGPQGTMTALSQVSKLVGALAGLPQPIGSMIILDLGNLVLAPHLIPPRLIFPPNQDLERKFLKYAGGAAWHQQFLCQMFEQGTPRPWLPILLCNWVMCSLSKTCPYH